MGQFLNSINEVRKNYKNYDNWEQEQADERARKEYLATNLDIPKDKVELTTARAKTVICATEIMDKRSEDNCEDMEQLAGFIVLPATLGIQFGVPVLAEKYSKYLIKKIEKNRDALEKLKNSDMSSAKYRELQGKIEILDKKITKMPKKSSFYGQLLTIVATLLFSISFILWSTKQQKKASRIGRYQAKQDELQDVKNFVVYTPEQIKQAEETAAKLPDQKEKNEFLKFIAEIKAINHDKKAYKEWFKNKDPNEIEKLKSLNFTPEQLKLGNRDKELIVDIVKEINIQAEEYSENIENAYDTLGNVSWLIAAPLGFGINKLLKLCKVNSKMIRAGVSFAVPILTSFGISINGTLQQKKASRVGRYIARQDLLKNPARLLDYSDEDMEKAKHIKAEKQKRGLFEKIGGSFTFLGKYLKDKKAYKKYKKEEQNKTEKMQKAFNQIEITDVQEKDAENLQKNVFRAFDEIDEMSQRYSEDVEAGTDIAKQLMSISWSLVSLAAAILPGLAIAKGKFPISKITNSIVNAAFKKESGIRCDVNNLYNVLKKDKKLMHEFQKSIVSGELNRFLTKEKSKEISEAFNKLIFNRFSSLADKLNEPEAFEKAVTDIIKKDLKNGVVAKWTRNLISGSLKLYINFKFGAILPKEIADKLGLNNWKTYQTLIGTTAVTGLPILGTIIGVPYAFNAWLTNIQKKAGKIGIMKAMNKIDDPRVFAPAEPIYADNKTPATKNPEDTGQSNLLKRYRQQMPYNDSIG